VRFRLSGDRGRCVELHQLKPAVAVRSPQHGDVDSDVGEPDDTVHPRSLDRPLALQLHTKFDKERNSSLKVVENDGDVVHPLNRHITSIGSDGRGAWTGLGGVEASVSTMDLHLVRARRPVLVGGVG
jgi:hypothetical protein